MNLENHPCFNKKAHGTFGRVHLPVAPRCNIQCRFCNRKFDCVNESRPGVTSGVLTPHQAMVYLKEVFRQKSDISVAGIAGPGDPFANPSETLETLQLIRDTYPDMLLCVATNGLNIRPYLDDLARLKVSHVTLTVNAVDPTVSTHIYAWVRHGKRVLRAEQGATILLENQLAAIKALKTRGITVKVNSIILPGINETHIEAVAKTVAGLGADVHNCVPYHPSAGSAFEDLEEPPAAVVAGIRKAAGRHLPQMRHCTRCRADAVGLLGEASHADLMATLQACERLSEESTTIWAMGSTRPNVAVASQEGVLVNQHLGEASRILVYGKKEGVITLLGARDAPQPGAGFQRWAELSHNLRDCRALLVSGIGENPRRALSASGIEILEIEGVIDEAVRAVFDGRSIRHLIRREPAACSAGCSGSGMGCS